MLRVGQAEIDALSPVIHSGKLFRYGENGQCERFEKRYAEWLGVKHTMMTSSGTMALVAALGALGIGPGDEVIVPAHTYMATAVAVLHVGAIPVIVDVDESIMLDPKAFEAAIDPRTRAAIPVHMWGHVCDMKSILEIARRRSILVIEDACQGVGGAYEGRKLGSMGNAGAFSFNYFKNMTCGEGGAVAINDDDTFERARCMIDCCAFFWNGKSETTQGFAVGGSRASEIEGAMMNAQLDRIDELIATLRARKKKIRAATSDIPGFKPVVCHSIDHECATHLMYQLPSPEAADAVASRLKCGVVGKTGRHTFNEWDPILKHRAWHHPLMNPYQMPANAECRKEYPPDLCAKSLAICRRTVIMSNSLDKTEAEIDQWIAEIRAAAQEALAKV